MLFRSKRSAVWLVWKTTVLASSPTTTRTQESRTERFVHRTIQEFKAICGRTLAASNSRDMFATLLCSGLAERCRSTNGSVPFPYAMRLPADCICTHIHQGLASLRSTRPRSETIALYVMLHGCLLTYLRHFLSLDRSTPPIRTPHNGGRAHAGILV